jgi:hypothetical protein
MTTDNFAIQMVELQEFANLIGISGCEKNLVAPLLKLLDDGYEKWDMGRIIDIDPDFLPILRRDEALEIPDRKFP